MLRFFLNFIMGKAFRQLPNSSPSSNEH